jgi:hypothetical protein
MAIPTNTSTTYSAIGIRESLANVIYAIAPLDTPFFSQCSKQKVDNTFFEWQTDTISAGAANRQLEGDGQDSTSADARENPVRVGNYAQISRYIIQTSGTNEQVDYAGRKSSQAYQLAKKAKRMKRDIEFMLTSNVARNAGATATARISAGLPAWIATNYHSLGSGAATGTASSGNGTDIATDATTDNSITEAGIKTVIKEAYESGGDPDVIMCKPDIKQAISDLTQTVSSLRTAADKVAPAHVVAAVDVYVSDFGTFKILPNRNQARSQDVYILDMDHWAMGVLRDFKTVDLAVTGDSQRQMLIYEAGLMSKNQKSSGYLANVTT